MFGKGYRSLIVSICLPWIVAGLGPLGANAEPRLPDFSHAGYREGKVLIPNLKVAANVKDFGAKGDGKTDDSQAFLDAIAKTASGAISIPPGRYVITRVLKIDKSNLVLRGAGQQKTILYFPKSLTEVVGDGKTHAPGNSWSWSGAFVDFEGEDNGVQITTVTAPARRGDFALRIASTKNLKRGQDVRLLLWNTDGTLGRHLYGDQLDAAANLKGKKLIDFCSRIKKIRRHRIVLERPLRTDVRLEWKPVLYSHAPSVQEVGVEDLTIEFPTVLYPGHHMEPGFNAIEFSGVSNGWARHVKIVNADSGLFFRSETKFCTSQDVEFAASSGRLRMGYGNDRWEAQTKMVGGHHGISASGLAQDNLCVDFEMRFRFIHDLSVGAMAAGNVFARGRGIDFSLDHHRKAPFENLFYDLDAGEGARLWESGGDAADGPHSGIGETFWKIRTMQPQKLPDWAVESNFIAVVSSAVPSGQDSHGNWVAASAPAKGLLKQLQ